MLFIDSKSENYWLEQHSVKVKDITEMFKYKNNLSLKTLKFYCYAG